MSSASNEEALETREKRTRGLDKGGSGVVAAGGVVAAILVPPWTQIIGAGLEEYLLNPAGVTVVEWAERYFDFASPQPGLLRVSIETLGETERRITYEDFGA